MRGTTVILDGIEAFVSLKLWDSNLSEIELPENLWRTAIELQPGAYMARFSTSVWEREEPFLVLPKGGSSIRVIPREVADTLVRSAAPLRRSDGYLNVDADAASRIAASPPVQIPGRRSDGSLLLVIRKRLFANCGAEGIEVPFEHSPWQDISLIDSAGKHVLDLDKAALPDFPMGLTGVHLALPEGPYRLRIVSGSGTTFVSQFLFVVRQHQTQVFVLDYLHEDRAQQSWIKARVSIQIVQSGQGFTASSGAMLATEELMNLLEVGASLTPAPAWIEKLKELNYPALNLAFSLIQVDPWRERTSLAQDVLEDLGARLPGLPDVKVMLKVARFGYSHCDGEQLTGEFKLRDLPMTKRGWDIALYAEVQAGLTIPSDSILVRFAESTFVSGPWLRIGENEGDQFVEQSKAQLPATDWEADIFQQYFRDAVLTLRELVKHESAVRIPYGPTHFTSTERRLIDQICPEADSAVFRILSGSGVAIDIPDGEGLVRALRLPTYAIYTLASRAIEKLSECRLLPRRELLQSFVLEESAQEGILLEPLESLQDVQSKLFHFTEEEPLSLLSIVYLRFRGCIRSGKAFPTTGDLALFLTQLGYAMKQTRNKVEAKDVDRTLRDAEVMLSQYHKMDSPPSEGGAWEDIEVRFTEPAVYKPGSLCKVDRKPAESILPPVLERAWHDHEFSYSISLKLAADPSFGREVSDRSKQLRLEETLGEKPGSDRLRRYLANVRGLERVSLQDVGSGGEA